MFKPPPLYSLKKRCRWRVAVPSFVYRAGYLENVRALGPYVDEIELLFLESRRESDLPDRKLVQGLQELQIEFDLTYNVHLPADVKPNAPEPVVAGRDTATLQRFIDRTLSLNPNSFCLHLPYAADAGFAERCHTAMNTLLRTGISSRHLTVENLDYPLTDLADLISALDVGVCFDIGHALAFGTGFNEHVAAFQDRMSMLHLHAPEKGRDAHRALSFLGDDWPMVFDFLLSYKGTLTLEVFSISHLNDCLAFLEPYLEDLA